MEAQKLYWILTQILFKIVYAKFLKFLKYVKCTILIPIKDKVIKALTDCLVYIVNTITNRVKISHSKQKKYMEIKMSDFLKEWKSIINMIQLQLTEILASFHKSVFLKDYKFNSDPEWTFLFMCCW